TTATRGWRPPRAGRRTSARARPGTPPPAAAGSPATARRAPPRRRSRARARSPASRRSACRSLLTLSRGIDLAVLDRLAGFQRLPGLAGASEPLRDGRGLRLAVVALVLEVGDGAAHRGLDAVERRLRVQAEEQAEREQWDDDDDLAEGDVAQLRVLALRLAGE